MLFFRKKKGDGLEKKEIQQFSDYHAIYLQPYKLVTNNGDKKSKNERKELGRHAHFVTHGRKSGRITEIISQCHYDVGKIQV